jgi:DNA-binding transcriptional LysR family regulator
MESGELKIGAGESTILYIMPEPVRRFVEAYPKVQLKIHNVTGRDGLKMLRSDEIDFAVGSMLEVPEDIEYKPVVNYDPMLITPLGHPLAEKAAAGEEVTLEDVSQYGLILPPSASVHLAHRQIRVPAEQPDLHRHPGSRRLGSDQEICRTRHGHLHRHRHLHDRQRKAGQHSAHQILPATQLRPGAATRPLHVAAGAALRRDHGARTLRSRFSDSQALSLKVRLYSPSS